MLKPPPCSEGSLLFLLPHPILCAGRTGRDNFKRLLVVHGSWLMAHMEMGTQGVIFVRTAAGGSWLVAHGSYGNGGGSCVLWAQGVDFSKGC